METPEETSKVDWKDSMLKVMKLIGELSNDWHPELWADYGITRADSKKILKEYERKFGRE